MQKNPSSGQEENSPQMGVNNRSKSVLKNAHPSLMMLPWCEIVIML